MYSCERCNKNVEVNYASGRFCSRKCAATRDRPESVCLKISAGVKLSEASNPGQIGRKGINRKPKIQLRCSHCGVLFEVSPSGRFAKYCSRTCANKSPNIGGAREGSGYGKCGWYKDFYCGSTWELAFLIWALDMMLNIKRCKTRYPYTFNEQQCTYLPDFTINEFTIEIKGQDTERTQAKISQCDISNLIVLRKEHLKSIFDYVKMTYGTNFIELYEGNPHNMKNNACKKCSNPCKTMFCSRSCAMKGNRKVTHMSADLIPHG